MRGRHDIKLRAVCWSRRLRRNYWRLRRSGLYTCNARQPRRTEAACAACNATQGYSTDTNECTCQANEILVETEGLNGTYAKTCVACARNMFAVWEDVTKGGAFLKETRTRVDGVPIQK